MRGTVVRQLSSASAHHSSTGLCGPAVRLLIQHYGLDGKEMPPTGPKKNLLKSDVLSFVKSSGRKPVIPVVVPPPDPSPPVAASTEASAAPKLSPVIGLSKEKYIDIPLTGMRSAIAKRLTLSKQSIPHQYEAIDVPVDALTALRTNLKKDGIAVSVNDFIIKAAGVALRAVPSMNVRWTENGVEQLPFVDISVAVATPTGLITPIVTNADAIGIRTISQKVKDLSVRAKENKLQPHEFQGGSFTISNLGMFGSVDRFTAIINPPQAAILAIGASRNVLDADLNVSSRFTATLCFDGRAISEETATNFLQHFSLSLADPDWMVAEPLDPALDFDFARLL